MSTDAIALVAGTVLAVAALAFVLQPLFVPTAGEPAPPAAPDGRAAADSAILALREIEFDRATGKLSDADYAELRRIHSARALRELRALRASASATVTASRDQSAVVADPMDPIEAKVRAVRARHRECVTCGVRPEPDAIYCSSCGRALHQGPASAPTTPPGI